MGLTEKEVEHLAGLARLKLTPGERQMFTSQLSEVVEYVAKVQSLNDKVLEQEAAASAELRPDEVKVWPQAGELVELAPGQRENLITVPEVFSDHE